MIAFKPHRTQVFQLAFSPDGAAVATSGRGPVVCVSDAATGRRLWQADPRCGLTIGLGLAYSPDGSRLAAVDWSTVVVFDARSGDVLHRFPGRGYAVAFTPDGGSVVAGTRVPGCGVVRISLATGAAAPVPDLTEFQTVNRLRHSPDGRFLAALVPVGVLGVTVLDTGTGALVARRPVWHATDGVGALAFHPAAPLLVYSGGPALTAYDLGVQATVAERRRSTKYIQDAAFAPDGRHLITVSNEATAVLWETAGWTAVREFAWEVGPLKAVAVAPDGARAACASARGRVVLWDLDG